MLRLAAIAARAVRRVHVAPALRHISIPSSRTVPVRWTGCVRHFSAAPELKNDDKKEPNSKDDEKKKPAAEGSEDDEEEHEVVTWFHRFNSGEDKLSSPSFIHRMFNSFILRKMKDLNPVVSEENILEGAKEVYKIVHNIAFNKGDVSLLKDAMDEESLKLFSESMERNKSYHSKLLEVKDAQILALDTKMDEERNVNLLVGVQLLTKETIEVVEDGVVTIAHQDAFFTPKLMLKCRLGSFDGEELVMDDVQWKLVVQK